MSAGSESLDPQTEALVRQACAVFLGGLEMAMLLYPAFDLDEPTRCEECFWLGASALLAAQRMNATEGEPGSVAARAVEAMVGTQVHTIRERYGKALAEAFNAIGGPDTRQ